MKVNNVISLHFHPGLKAEIKLYLEKYNADFYGDNQYGFNQRKKSFFKLFSSNQRFIFYNTSIGNLFFLYLKLILKNKEIYYCFHEPILPLSIKNSLLDNIKCIVVNIIHTIFFVFSDKIIVFSECGKNKVPISFHNKIEIQKLPFDFHSLIKHRPSANQNGNNTDMLDILFYGNLNSGKNPTEFIELFKHYKGNNFRLKIVTSSESYYNYVVGLEGDFIVPVYKKELSDIEVIDLILSTDIILLPHRRCTQSAIFEKSSYLGKPVFFGPCKGFNEFIDIYGLNFGNNLIEFNSNLEKMYNNYEIYKNNCLLRHL